MDDFFYGISRCSSGKNSSFFYFGYNKFKFLDEIMQSVPSLLLFSS